jgi:ABC-type glycerol-3-phosphate transport system substrate-binding protein
MKSICKIIALCALCALTVLPFAACDSGGDEDMLRVNYVANLAPAAGSAADGLAAAEARMDKNDSTVTSAYRLSYDLSKYAANALSDMGMKIEFVNWGWDAALIQKQTNSLMSSGKRDAEVYIGDPMWLKRFIYMNGLLPFPDDLQAHIEETMLPSAYSSMTADGKMYGVNIFTTPMMLYVNLDVVKKVWPDTYGEYQPPKTWSEFIAQSEAALAKNVIPGAICVKSGNDGYLRNNLFFRQQGFDFETETPINFNNDNVKEALKFLNKVTDLNRDKVTATDAGQIQSKFVGGESMFMIESTTLYKQYQTAKGSKISNVLYCPVPVPDAVPSDADYDPAAAYGADDAMGTMICTLTLSVPRYVGAEKQTAAFAYIRAMCDETPQAAIRDERSLCSLNRNVIEDGEFVADPANETVVLFNNALKSGNMMTMPTFYYQNAKSWQQVGNAITRVTVKSSSAPDYDKIMADSQAQLTVYYGQG